MTLAPRLAAVTAVSLALGAGPALAGATTSPSGAVDARTPLVAKIAGYTALGPLKYQLREGGGPVVDGSLSRDADTSADEASSVDRVHADDAQYPAKLEWVLGRYVEDRGDKYLRYGTLEQVDGHTSVGDQAVRRGLAELRLSNFLIARADTSLGIRHPALAAEPYVNTPLDTKEFVARTPEATLTGMIAAATPVLEENLPEHIPAAYLALNKAASHYYAVLIARLHVDGAQRAAQSQWVDGVRGLERGDEQLSRGSGMISGVPVSVAARHEIQQGLGTLRQADAEIARADAELGVHPSGPTVGLPAKVLYSD